MKLTFSEMKNLVRWQAEHLKTCSQYAAGINGTLFFKEDFSSGIGTVTTVTCSCGGKEVDITDYNLW